MQDALEALLYALHAPPLPDIPPDMNAFMAAMAGLGWLVAWSATALWANWPWLLLAMFVLLVGAGFHHGLKDAREQKAMRKHFATRRDLYRWDLLR